MIDEILALLQFTFREGRLTMTKIVIRYAVENLDGRECVGEGLSEEVK